MQSRFFLLLSALLLLAVAAADADPKAKAKANPMDGQLGSESTKGGDKMAGYPKKANSGKKRPTKTPTTAAADGAGNATDATALSDDFKNLGGDDLEFIAAVEKQFSMYGGKLKFKIEHDNATDPKNPKRTVDGELGYGYSQEGYEYRKPAFMFYPYSQKDIAADAPGYYGGGSVGHGGHAGGGSVTVQSSYSYELQPQTYEVQGQPQLDVPATSAQAYQAPTGGAEAEAGHQQQQHYEEPVIVLRIPGPTKYAAHLQALLQQYLQIRATQYLQILENAAHKDEYQQQQGGGQLLQQAYQDEGAASPGQQQQYAEQQYGHEQQEVVAQQHDEAAPPSAPQHPSYEEHAASGATSPQHQPYEVPQYDQASHDYQQEISAHPGLSGAHPPPYPDIGDVYQGYKDRHAHLQHHLQHQQQAAHHHIAGTHVEEAEYCPETDFHGPAVTESAPSFYFPHDHAHHFQHDHAHHFQHGSRLSTSVTDSYQPFVLFSMSTPIYDSPADGGPHLATHHGHAYGPEAHLNSYDHQLHTSENNPRPTHTQVLFTPKRGEEGATDNESMYALPSIRPHERHPAAPQPSQPFYPPQHPHQHQHPQRRPQQQQPHPQHFQQQHLQQQHLQPQHLQPQHLQPQHLQPQHLQQPRPFQKQQFQQQQLQQQQLQQQVLQQQQQHEAPQSPSSEEAGQQQPISSAAPAPQNGVLLDQKSFNYHAHPARRRTRNNTKRESSQAVESTHFGDKINAKKSAKTGAEAQ